MEETNLANSTKNFYKIILAGILVIESVLLIALYHSLMYGLASMSQLWIGLILLVLGAFLSVHQFGLKQKKFTLFEFP
ncbi:MAG TPA: hypothetical protein VD731_06855 [Nitrosopumilaceae archaeon]|nr:hypothetical protein [Nitrosopumilaceae archaeon]